MKIPSFVKGVSIIDTVANEPNVPEWAMEKALALVDSGSVKTNEGSIAIVARALVEAHQMGLDDKYDGINFSVSLKRARAEALEEAAKEMDEWADAAKNVRSSKDTLAAYKSAAAAIRALKSPRQDDTSV